MDRKTDQTVKKALELLEVKYGRSFTERIEKCVNDLLKFREDQYKDDGELLLAMEEIRDKVKRDGTQDHQRQVVGDLDVRKNKEKKES